MNKKVKEEDITRVHSILNKFADLCEQKPTRITDFAKQEKLDMAFFYSAITAGIFRRIKDKWEVELVKRPTENDTRIVILIARGKYKFSKVMRQMASRTSVEKPSPEPAPEENPTLFHQELKEKADAANITMARKEYARSKIQEPNLLKVPPAIEDLQAYCKKRHLEGNPLISSQNFYDYYQSNGWMVGNHKMVDWQAAVRTWEHNIIKREKFDTPVKTPLRKYDSKELMDEVQIRANAGEWWLQTILKGMEDNAIDKFLTKAPLSLIAKKMGPRYEALIHPLISQEEAEAVLREFGAKEIHYSSVKKLQ